MKLLVTGAGGFIGSRLVTELAGRHDVVALARQPGAPHDGVEWVQQDLTEPLDRGKLPNQIDGVIHLAQSRHYRDFPGSAADIFAVNVAGTFALLEYARTAGAETFVFTSSGGVYGFSFEPFVEGDPVSPLNFYLGSKYSAELLIGNYAAYFRTVVLRPFFVYGPGQQGMLVPNLVARVLGGEPVLIEGTPGLRINPIHVDDAVRAFEPALALDRSGLFNVAGDEVVTMTELVELIGRTAARRPRITYRDSVAGGDLVGDNTAMKQTLGIVPRVPLHEGLQCVVERFSASSVV